jgi:LSD1 subclass zinc finger protein
MPIEIRCSKCDTLLRVPDGSGGRETRCPSCQTMLRVPSPPAPPTSPAPADGASDATAAGPDVRSAEQEANPFAAPTSQPQAGLADGVSPFAGTPPVRLDIGDLLTRTFAIFRQNIGTCLAAGAIVYFPSYLVMAAVLGPTKTLGLLAGSFMAEPFQQSDMGPFAIATLINIPLGVFLMTGLVCLSLQLARTGGGPLGLLFSGGRHMISVFFSYLMFSIAMSVGMLLCCVPGIWVAIVFSQFIWLIVDGRAGILDSFAMSKQLTEGHRLNIFWLFLLAMAASTVTSLIPFSALILQPIIYPVMMILGALVYLTLTGQPVAGGATSSPGPVTVAAPSGGATHGPAGAPPEPPPPDLAN